MAFFKFRKSPDDATGLPAQGESVEAMRKRATFRLIGSAVLVLAGVIGFPLLFDSQPRPIPVDIAIEIPDKAKVKPLAAPVAMPQKPVEEKPMVPNPAPPAALKDAPVAPAASDKKITDLDVAKNKTSSSIEKETDPATKNDKHLQIKESNNSLKPNSNEKDGDRALALLDGKAAASAASKTTPADKAAAPGDNVADAKGGGRFVVQVGAYSDAARVKEARAKLESAGLKTYAQVVETEDGQRTRVRVGPFADKAEADRVAQKVKSLDLPAAILAL